MRIAHLYFVYSDLARRIAEVVPGFERLASDQQLAALHRQYYYYDGYAHGHRANGWEAIALPTNIPSYYTQWARAHGHTPEAALETLIVARVKAYAPDILFFHPHTPGLLRRLKAEVPSIRLVAIPYNAPGIVDELLEMADCAITCSLDLLETLARKSAKPRAYIPHGFASHLLPALQPASPTQEVVFTGSVIRGAQFHYQREQLLIALASAVPVAIYSPSASFTQKDAYLVHAKRLLYDISQRIPVGSGLDALLRRAGFWQKTRELAARPDFPVHPALKGRFRPAVYGVEMLQLLRDAAVSVNVHPDLTVRFASNIRLFEAGGVGGCLLTDWKENMADFYADGTEVVLFKTPEEAVEKARYLLHHSEEARAIGRRAAVRTARAHTLVHRMGEHQAFLEQQLA